jgi:hypothetical protein
MIENVIVQVWYLSVTEQGDSESYGQNFGGHWDNTNQII